MNDYSMRSNRHFFRQQLSRNDDFHQRLVCNVGNGIDMLEDVRRGVVVTKEKKAVVDSRQSMIWTLQPETKQTHHLRQQNPLDYNTERENNIIKNIAKEIVLECIQNNIDETQELANYLVKLKLLNPKNGFTATEVMPRSLTQQLVLSVVEDLKRDTPAMNCIRMQVYWNSINLNVADLKKEYLALMMDRTELYLQELLSLEREDINKLTKLLASYILVSQNLGNVSHPLHLKETVAAIQSVFKNRDTSIYFTMSEESKMEAIKRLTKKITGIRLYLKMVGKAGEGIDDVKALTSYIEYCKEEVSKMSLKVSSRINDIREVISSVVTMDYFMESPGQLADIYLPPDCDLNDLKHLKQILVIMLQHNFYLSNMLSLFEEVKCKAINALEKCDEALMRLNATIRDRDAVPTSEVYEDFIEAGELWSEIQSYFFCVESIETAMKNLKNYNKKEHFHQMTLEKAVNLPPKVPEDSHKMSIESRKTLTTSSVFMKESEDYNLEFRGFCAWTLYFADGLLMSGTPKAGIFQLNDKYYSFSSKIGYELWSKDPTYYLMEIYEILRMNPEMVELLNAYENLYSTKSLQQVRKVDRKISTRSEDTQTVLHPVEKYWDKDYTFSEWELKKRALALSRLTKCVTKSVQTVDHSHFRASIGLYAAPDKDKQCQTRKDTGCGHSPISTYLYGLRGHYEDKFKPITLTRPVEETCEKQIILEKKKPCSKTKKESMKESMKVSFESCFSSYEEKDKCFFLDDYIIDLSCECNGEA